jgi:hypothetical protein
VYFAPINIQRVKLEMGAHMYVGIHVRHPVFLADFNQNWNVSIKFSVTSQFQI